MRPLIVKERRWRRARQGSRQGKAGFGRAGNEWLEQHPRRGVRSNQQCRGRGEVRLVWGCSGRRPMAGSTKTGALPTWRAPSTPYRPRDPPPGIGAWPHSSQSPSGCLQQPSLHPAPPLIMHAAPLRFKTAETATTAAALAVAFSCCPTIYAPPLVDPTSHTHPHTYSVLYGIHTLTQSNSVMFSVHTVQHIHMLLHMHVLLRPCPNACFPHSYGCGVTTVFACAVAREWSVVAVAIQSTCTCLIYSTIITKTKAPSSLAHNLCWH